MSGAPADDPGGGPAEPQRIFDAGLQPERTALAWRRTALSLVVAGLGAARLLLPQLGAGAVVLGLFTAATGAVVHVLASRRARRTTARLLASGDLDHPAASAHLIATTAAACALIGLGGLALVVSQGLAALG
ncbi:DUF202 domain-containing protein [Paenibacillus sp. TRM 82003]|uniref:DUF202 domain-containing protein n=1 Tax=Kineococcus sp. TRM81007 TaxID=2925831 RepID=UPI001F5766C4|nr:DUF202 domain-containing protein [Kineococcus sp. TRM81007]MCI2238695.1 DUF202 domain-containing protein [Kineococcus sp. TRM81007]MCI3927357.1 DUF202 domain-containing protein [Paenibacillus sp. TRM 82003]